MSATGAPPRPTPLQAAAEIRAALRRRSGRTWSVRVGRGSTYGWLTITAPPVRLGPGGEMTRSDACELARLLGISQVHSQGVLVEADPRIRDEWVARAHGLHPDQGASSSPAPVTGFLAGERVIARYRYPSALQPWLREFSFGTVAEPDGDPSQWRGTGSERDFCHQSGLVAVDYPYGRQYEQVSELVRVSREEERMDHGARVARFLGPGARRALDRVRGGAGG